MMNKIVNLILRGPGTTLHAHHHSVTLTLTALPLLSWVTKAQPVLTAILTLCGIAWYGWLFYSAWRDYHRDS